MSNRRHSAMVRQRVESLIGKGSQLLPCYVWLLQKKTTTVGRGYVVSSRPAQRQRSLLCVCVQVWRWCLVLHLQTPTATGFGWLIRREERCSHCGRPAASNRYASSVLHTWPLSPFHTVVWWDGQHHIGWQLALFRTPKFVPTRFSGRATGCLLGWSVCTPFVTCCRRMNAWTYTCSHRLPLSAYQCWVILCWLLQLCHVWWEQ